MSITTRSHDLRDGLRALSDLYEADEVAWLDAMARLAAERRFEEFDCDHLGEFLNDMAIRERREVMHRLTTLLMHLVKWECQQERRSGSWRRTILEQRHRLSDLLESRTLRIHAEEVFLDAYRRAIELASAETGLAPSAFPASFAGDLDNVLNRDLPA